MTGDLFAGIMSTAKETMVDFIARQPDDSSYDEYCESLRTPEWCIAD